MKKLSFAVLAAAFLTACQNQPTTNGRPEDDADAARMFIRHALDGNYKEARKILLPDSANTQLLENIERSYLQNNNVTDQRGYREASINMHNIKKLNDSITVVVYSNSFKKQRDSLKVVKAGDGWLIDLKYSFPKTGYTP